MPSLHLLWKTVHLHTETQNRLKSLFARSLFNVKPIFSYLSEEPVPQFEVSKSSQKFSEGADSSKLLYIPQAAYRTLATPSVHGRVWHNCYGVPFQFLWDKNQVVRSKQKLGWMLTASLFGTLNIPHSMLESRLHVVSPEVPSGSSTHAITSVNCQGHHSLSSFNKKAVGGSGSNHLWSQHFSGPFFSCNLHSSGVKGFLRNSVQDEKVSTNWLLNTSLAFHCMRYGFYLLPAVHNSLESSLLGFNGGASSIAMQPGIVSDSGTDKCNAENSEGSLSSPGLRLLSAACCLPHPEKQDTGGEDAYFICPDKQVIGVADGVGGWADMGIDAGEYARQLMTQSLIAAQQEPVGCIDTARVMEIAHSKTTCRGSSTACILALSNYCLQAANLGDSGFLVVRNGRTTFKSPPQQHNFNVPFQLENGGGDPPGAAQVFSVEVAAGDVVVAGTDGLFDNLYDKDIVSLVVQATRSGSSPDITAKKIATLARERAQDCNRQTPFSAAAQDAGFRFYGGKMDDITVIVSYVVN